MAEDAVQADSAPGVRILSCMPQWTAWGDWNRRVTNIEAFDPKWRGRSLAARAVRAAWASRSFDVVVLHYDHRLAALLGCMKRARAMRASVVLTEMYYDVSPMAGGDGWRGARARDKLRHALYWSLTHSVDAIVVHTSAEVELYARFFGVSPSKFQFTPFYPDADARAWEGRPRQGYVLAVGRQRDFKTFNEAMTGSRWSGVIVAGRADREAVIGSRPKNVRAYFEVPTDEYRERMAGAELVVIPLHAGHRHRASGQIALLEACQMRRPVIAARTFQLADYALDGEVCFYEPGNPADLRNKIDHLMENADVRAALAERGAAISARITSTAYARVVLELCLRVARRS